MKKTLKLVEGVLSVPRFTISFHRRRHGAWVDLWHRRVYLPKGASEGEIAHELGHLVFQQALKETAPTIYGILKATAYAEGRSPVAKKMNELDILINAYAEPFCDLLGIMVSERSTIFPVSNLTDVDLTRDWTKPLPLPWESKRNPRPNFRLPASYNRMAEFRRWLWAEYRDELHGSLAAKRRILKKVVRAMAQELEEGLLDFQRTDQERNRALLERLRRSFNHDASNESE